MNSVILHPRESGVAVILPTGEISVEEVARKDVPAGLPYLIVDAGSLPDLALIDAWEADFSEPDGHGIGAEAWFAEQAERQAQAKEEAP